MTDHTQITTTALAPWFGAARMMAKHVGPELAGCKWCGIPFAGGMPEVLAIDAPAIACNDTHRAVINLAKVAADARLGPQLYRHLRRLPFHPETLSVAQMRCLAWEDDDFREILPDPCFPWAIDYFTAVWMGRSGRAGTDDELHGNLSTRWNANGGDSNTRFRSAVRSLIGWRRALARCSFTTLDAFDFLGRCQDIEANGIYCDPPFPGAGDRYTHKFSSEQHVRLAGVLDSFERARVVCRFYDHPLVRELYPENLGWVWRRFKGRKQSNAVGPEVLILNGPSRETQKGTP